MPEQAKVFNCPFFVKPRQGIGSEHARLIENQKELGAYIREKNRKGHFVFEETLKGYEIDAHIILWDGKFRYGAISDNFLVFFTDLS